MQSLMAKLLATLASLQTVLMLPFAIIPIKITTPASVFECGDNYYVIIWETSRKGSGFVTYTYDGTDYTVSDQTLGNINTGDTIHSVKVPKSHIDNNTYTYHSQHVLIKLGYSAFKGLTVSSEPVRFRGYNGQNEINSLVLSDIHGDYEQAEKAINCFEKQPDFIIMNGDISSELITKRDFADKILNAAYKASCGEIPVVYTRGNHETRGEFAPEIAKYFKTSTGGLYYTCRYGPVWMLALDSGEDKEDGHEEYSGLVDFTQYIADETKWLDSLEADGNKSIFYRMTICHQPGISNRYGNNWTNAIANVGTSLLISGHTHTFDLNPAYNSGAPFKTVITGGKNKEHGFIATMLTFSGKSGAQIKAFGADGTLIADEKLDLSQAQHPLSS